MKFKFNFKEMDAFEFVSMCALVERVKGARGKGMDAELTLKFMEKAKLYLDGGSGRVEVNDLVTFIGDAAKQFADYAISRDGLSIFRDAFNGEDEDDPQR